MNTSHAAATDITSLVDLARQRAISEPNRTAYTFLASSDAETASLTYHELDRQARAIAATLQQHNGFGERAILLFQPSLDYIAAFLGCLYAGVIAVPAYPPRANRPSQRIQAIMADARAAFLLTTTPILEMIVAQSADLPGLAAVRCIATDTLPAASESGWQMPTIEPATLAFLQYTSGSTATPKGVMVSHGNLIANERMIQRAFGHDAEGSVVGWLPLYHDMGLIGNVLQPLFIGWQSILMSPLVFLQRPLRWLQAISRYRAHSSGGPNFAYDLCVAKSTPAQRADLDLSCWQVAFNGAEPVRYPTMARFAQAFAPSGFRIEAFYPCYGLAEATLFVAGSHKAAPPIRQVVDAAALEQHILVPSEEADESSRTLVGSGHAWLEQRIQIVDPQTCEACPADRIGEIWVSGPNVTQGYWAREQATRETFHAYLADGVTGPFMRTGDLGFLLDGELFVTGRLRDLIIIDGRNHYPQDIEMTIEQSHAALRPGCSAAFSVEQDGCERLVVTAEVERQYSARLEDAGGPNSDGELIKRAVRQAIAQQHDLQVSAIVLLKPGEIPKTSSGKIQRHLCRKGFLAGVPGVSSDLVS